jgi:hypothetical protein
MTTSEFSDSFDTLLNSYNTQAQFGNEASKREITLDEYEKSVFLTKAQEELVLSLYTGKNSYSDSFESSEEVRRYLANLVEEVKLKPITNTQGIPLGVTSTSKFFTLPEDLWFITLETVAVSDSRCPSRTLKVYPTKQDEYLSIRDNPFRGANDRRALRLDLSEGNVEIICKYTVSEYYVRYVAKLYPIILTDLPDGLSINGVDYQMGCTLHEALHQKILERAVTLALQSKGYNIQKENN